MKNFKDNHQNRKALPSESPHVFQDKLNELGGHNLSPIQNANWQQLENASQQHEGRLKFKDGKGKQVDDKKQQRVQNGEHYLDIEAPNTLVKEFYNRPLAQMNAGDKDYFNEVYEEDNSLGCQDYSSGNKNPNYPQNGDRFSKINLGKIQQQQQKQEILKGKQELTDFDLTAKEITSKRFDKGKIKQVVGGRVSSSPGEGVPSNSDTVKWAFSNKDSQETQKKVSVINREINARDLISKSLKSHDSRSNCQQQMSSNAVIRGKVLDFAGLDSSKNQEGGGFFKNQPQEKYLQGSIDESLVAAALKGERQIISFLEDEEELLKSNEKQNYVSNRNGYVSHTSMKGFNMKKANIGELFQLIIDNTMDCPLCNRQKVYDSSLNCSKIEEVKSRMEIIQENLEKKYLTSREYYNVKIINDIIYNENTHIVSVFKDYLIFDDVSEFLKRFYHKYEGVQRLPKMFEFYEKYSKVFPNYVSLPESKYMFKNIERKQKLYDEKQRIVMEQQEREERKNNGEFKLGSSADRKNGRHKDRFSSQNMGENSSNISQLSGNRMFDTKFIDSVANIHPSGFIDKSSIQSSQMHNSRIHDQILNSSLQIHQQLHENMENAKKKRKKKIVEELDLDELISKFIAKDTQSQIQSSQSSILPQSNKKQPPEIEKIDNAVVKKKPVYEYQEQKQIQPPSNIQSIQSESSKSLVDQSNRPVSAKLLKPPQDSNKRLSSGSSKQSEPQKPLKEQQVQINDPNSILNAEGKILNYNICNNYNQFLCPNHEFLPANHYINNENYFIAAEKLPEGIASQAQKSGSLQRNQSKSNLHTVNIVPIVQKDSCQTPLKTAVRNEMKTPISGEGDRRLSMENKLGKRALPQEAIHQQEYISQGLNLLQDWLQQIQAQQQQQEVSTQSLEKQTAKPIEVQQQTKAPSQKTRVSQQQISSSREGSKERQQQVQLMNHKQAGYNSIGPQIQREFQNQMFKNEMIQNLTGKQNQVQQQQDPSQNNLQSISHDQEYNTISSGQGQGNNVRSVERLKAIEDEIEKDYSKYVNEYGLTKTAFAKAVNALREKNSLKQQNVQILPLTTRQQKISQNSNEKQLRASSNIIRSSSTSQTRKSLGTRQIISKNNLNNNNGQESISDLYLNTNKNPSQKVLRTVRAKTHINSQNSSNCNQRSQRLSPDKNYMIQSSNNYGVNPNLMVFNQTATPSQQKLTPQGTYVTLKSVQPTKQAKGIKIKFPLNSQRSQQSNGKLQGQGNNNNLSSNQTPKRIKLQKTKSTSHIPLCFTQRGQIPSNFLQRGRGGPEMMILDEMSSKSGLAQNCFVRQSQNALTSSGLGFGEQYQSDNQLYQQPTYASSQCGTYATTSILNSPLSFKGQQNATGANNKVSAKGRSSSRNGANSQHQSQKSVGGGNNQGGSHQRTGSNSNQNVILSVSSNKIKSKDNKRMSTGSNQSKKSNVNSQTQQIHHQPTSSNIQQQIFQLLMSCQSQNQQDSPHIDSNGILSLSKQQVLPLSQTLKNLQLNSGSMKDLKQLRNPVSNCIQENVQTIPSKAKVLAQGALIQQQQQTSRQPQQNILMVNQNFRKNSKTGKNTQRGDSKKRQTNGGPYQIGEAPSTISNANQYSIATGNGQETSSRVDSQYMTENTKRILSFSKSQDNFDMIKLAAQRAAMEQQNQQTLQTINASSSQSQAQQPLKFLQNLKQSESQQQLLKVKLAPQPVQSSLQSARNLQFDSSSVLKQFRATPVNDYDQSASLSSKQPTNIIIQTSSQIEKPSSRRTSGKFNPSSAKSSNNYNQ